MMTAWFNNFKEWLTRLRMLPMTMLQLSSVKDVLISTQQCSSPKPPTPMTSDTLLVAYSHWRPTLRWSLQGETTRWRRSKLGMTDLILYFTCQLVSVQVAMVVEEGPSPNAKFDSISWHHFLGTWRCRPSIHPFVRQSTGHANAEGQRVQWVWPSAIIWPGDSLMMWCTVGSHTAFVSKVSWSFLLHTALKHGWCDWIFSLLFAMV